MNIRQVGQKAIELLRRTDSCTVSNAIETFNVRMRNEGYVQGSVTAFCLTFRRSPGTLLRAGYEQLHPPSTDSATIIATIGGNMYPGFRRPKS
jgi:hypothetical protein